MANDAREITVGAYGSIHVAQADLVVTPPVDVNTALSAAIWKHVGFTTDEGATLTDGKDITDISAWQSFYPVRKIVNSRSTTLAFGLLQWNRRNLELALGGTVSANGAGKYVYDPPSPEDLDERAIVLDWSDGDKDYRLFMPRGMVTDNVEINLQRTSAAVLPLTFTATDPGAGLSVYRIHTNDPNFAPGS